MGNKTGRPKSDNPKTITVKARIDADTDSRLQNIALKTI